MNLTKLVKITTKSKKRLGRGYGSGKAKTSGRGTKGLKARGKVKLFFEGGQLPLIKRLPLRRGKDKFKPFKKKPLVVNVKYLNLLPDKSVVDLATLVKHRIVKEDEVGSGGVKILGDGELDKALMVKLVCSGGARKKIEKAGGKVEVEKRKSSVVVDGQKKKIEKAEGKVKVKGEKGKKTVKKNKKVGEKKEKNE